MTPRRAVILSGALTAGVLGVVAWSFVRGPESAGSSPSAPEAAASHPAGALGFAYVADTTYTYRLRYASTTKAIPLVGVDGASMEGDIGKPIDGELALEGTLSIHAFPESPTDSGTGMLLGFSLSACTGHFRVAGQEAWPAGHGCREVTDGKELVVRMDARGEIQAVYTPEGGASLFDYTMRALVEETQVRLTSIAGLSSWAEAEPLPQGTVASIYKIVGTPSNGADVTLERSRARYTKLTAASMLEASAVTQEADAHHRIVIADRTLSKIDGKEKLRAMTEGKTFLESSTELLVEAKEHHKDARDRVDLSKLTRRGLTDLPESRSLRDRMLEQRAAGLSWEDALTTLSEHGDAGSLPDHNRFMWRATALLELVPRRAEDLIELFDGAKPGGRRRGLVMDLLASAGTPEAQSVLVRILASEKTKADPRYAHLVQRMGFVEAPTKESIGFVRASYASATKQRKSNERFAAAYALGSMADHAKDGDPKASKEIVDELTKDVGEARPDELVYFLNALANADSATSVPTFASYAGHADPDVREAVASALDDPPTTGALAVLLELAADPSRDVQRAALHSLRRYTLTAAAVVRLTRIAVERRFASTNVRFVADLVKSYRFVFPQEEVALLRALLAGDIDDALVRAALQQLLDAA